ncbi:MAG TPA: fumarylacetoacetase [Thermoanaerobaculia bacterium]|nr:fumarylacetoacetase [Thermoanaerobaculia bacterium]
MALKSWIESANDPRGDFPLENLPLGVFRSGRRRRIGVAIGDRILDLAGLLDESLVTEDCCSRPTLNDLMAKGPSASRALRERLTELLVDGAPDRHRVTKHLLPRRGAEMCLPCAIGDYTDFYASIHHATNVGSMFRPDNPLLPNYKWLPVGYHGRASSIVVSGTPVCRPRGQMIGEGPPPSFAPSRRLDYEVEIGAFVGAANNLGQSIPIADARSHIFGYCIVNDWSARDVQTWEYQPLGPFLAKSFATSISPWVVTAEALEPFRVAPPPRPDGDPRPLEHLDEQGAGALDVVVDVLLSSAQMRERDIDPVRLSRGNLRDMYWTFGQMIAHHTSNGCNLCPGDLIASGTISGEAKSSRGSLLELTWRGTERATLPTGEERTFLEDGDEVIMRAYCARQRLRIGFGECRGIVVGAHSVRPQ